MRGLFLGQKSVLIQRKKSTFLIPVSPMTSLLSSSTSCYPRKQAHIEKDGIQIAEAPAEEYQIFLTMKTYEMQVLNLL